MSYQCISTFLILNTLFLETVTQEACTRHRHSQYVHLATCVCVMACGCLTGQLLVELGHVIIPFSLVQVAGDGLAEAVLLGEPADRELSAVVGRPVGQTGLVEFDLGWLLVDEEDVAVEAWWMRLVC